MATACTPPESVPIHSDVNGMSKMSVNWAKRGNAGVVAEGVATNAQLQQPIGLRCDEFQG